MPRFSAKAKSRFYSNLEKYVRSGIGIEKACDSMLSQPGLKSAEREVLIELINGIQGGENIAQSLSRSRMKLSDVEIEIVTAAEKGGLLEKGLSHLADYFQRVSQTRMKILRGLAYPLLMINIAIPLSVLAIVMFGKAMPDADPESGWETAIKAGIWIINGYLIVLFIGLFVAWFFRAAKNSPGIDAFLNRIPLVGRARKSLALARFCEVFHIHMLAGLRMSDTLAGAGKAAQSGTISQAAEAGTSIVKDGNPLSDAIFGFPNAYPNDFARGIATAEQSGEMDQEIEQWARFYNEDAGEAMDQVAVWTPKIFYFIVLFFVAGLIIRMGMAYRDLIEGWLNV